MEDIKEIGRTSSYEIIDLKKIRRKLRELTQKFIDSKTLKENQKERPKEFYRYGEYINGKREKIHIEDHVFTSNYKTVECLKEIYDMFYTEVFLSVLKNQGVYIKEEPSQIEIFRTMYSWNIIKNQKTWIRLMRDIEDFDGFSYSEIVQEITNRIPLFIKEFKRIINEMRKAESKVSYHDELKDQPLYF